MRRALRLWDISGDGVFWKVQLDIRDLGGHLDFTYRARAGSLSRRVGKATFGVAAVGALPLGFRVKLGLVRGKFLSWLVCMLLRLLMFSSSSISAFRAAIVRSVWSTRMPLANTPAILNLLDGPVDVDPAFYIVIRSRFRMMRRYLAYCPEEEPRIFFVCWILSLGVLRVMVQSISFLSQLLRLAFAWDSEMSMGGFGSLFHLCV